MRGQSGRGDQAGDLIGGKRERQFGGEDDRLQGRGALAATLMASSVWSVCFLGYLNRCSTYSHGGISSTSDDNWL